VAINNVWQYQISGGNIGINNGGMAASISSMAAWRKKKPSA